MGELRALFLAGAALVGIVGFAHAADLLPPPPPMEAPPPIAPPEFSGWYLRGDVGLAVSTSEVNTAISPNPLTNLPAGAFNTFYNSTISSAALADVGVGYQFNNWLRFDITGEYRGGSHFQSLEQVAIPAASTQLADFYRGDASSVIGLVNGYVDLGTWYNITPFVGAGVGVAYNRLSGMTDTGFVYIGPGSTGSPTGGYLDNGTKTSLAWSLMAGLAFDVTQNLKLELGYRYLDYGKFQSGSSHCFNGTGAGGGFSAGACGGSAYSLSTSDQVSQDFRLGLRWAFSETPMYAPDQPLVRKY